MFVYNIKVSSGKIFKLIFVLMILIVLVITGIVMYKTFSNSGPTQSDDIYTIDSTNYTNILKAVHDNIDTYVGQKISFSGYIYRVYDLQDDEFVLARDMVINSDFQTLVVGFLCHSDNSSNYKDGTWVNIVGKIEKGYYHGDIPIINISQIEETTKPTDAYVYPPDDFYIPTSSLLYSSPW